MHTVTMIPAKHTVFFPYTYDIQGQLNYSHPPPPQQTPKNKNKKTTDVKIYILFQLKLSPSAIKL